MYSEIRSVTDEWFCIVTQSLLMFLFLISSANLILIPSGLPWLLFPHLQLAKESSLSRLWRTPQSLLLLFLPPSQTFAQPVSCIDFVFGLPTLIFMQVHGSYCCFLQLHTPAKGEEHHLWQFLHKKFQKIGLLFNQHNPNSIHSNWVFILSHLQTHWSLFLPSVLPTFKTIITHTLLSLAVNFSYKKTPYRFLPLRFSLHFPYHTNFNVKPS